MPRCDGLRSAAAVEYPAAVRILRLRPLCLLVTSSLSLASCSGAAGPIDAEIAKTPAGQITVVEFVDYKCDFCQTMHGVLSPLLAEQEGRVRVVIKQVPLAEHRGAKEAAYAAICAEKQGKLPAVHDALMKGAGVGDEQVLDLAQHAGVDLESFKACLRSDEPKERVAADTAAYEAAGGDGLPMVFIQNKKFVGVTDVEPLEQALRDAP